MLISVHLPKTAGSSFVSVLEAHFEEALLKDYGDRPINVGTIERNIRALSASVRNSFAPPDFSTVHCIHGHFMPVKYRLLSTPQKKRYVVWMRDPVERLASHYHYWQRSFDPASSLPLHRRVVEEQWSLERFCLGPELRNIYQKFFWGFPVKRFSFIGITEHFDTELQWFGREVLGTSVASQALNINPERGRQVYIEDAGFRRRIEAFHQADMGLYCHALELRQLRLGGDDVETAE